MDNTTFWLIIIFGPLLGVAGGAYGAWNTIRNTKGPREREFAIRMTVYMVLGLIVFLGGLMFIPKPWNFLMWIPYGPALAWFVRYFNRRQQELQQEEAGVMGG